LSHAECNKQTSSEPNWLHHGTEKSVTFIDQLMHLINKAVDYKICVV